MEAGGGWGRQGGSKARGVYREGVPLPDAPIETNCKLEHAPITARVGKGPVDGKGGESSQTNNLNESFQCELKCWEKERQAQPYPQNWVGWCPGSSLTNHSYPHPRAGWEWPMSANDVSFEIGSRPDHPRSYTFDCQRTPRRLGRPLVERRKLRGKIFRVDNHNDCGFYFGSRAIKII